MISRSNRQRNTYQQWNNTSSPLERLSPYASPRMPVPDQAVGEGATKVYQMLAKKNMALFLDVWPLHMFYKRFGLERFKRCLPERQSLRGSVVWPIEAAVPFGAVQPRVMQAFEAIDAGNTAGGVKFLAEHEQLNVLRRAIFVTAS
nr:hypothetical protein [Paraburkholderia sp. HP33-1]